MNSAPRTVRGVKALQEFRDAIARERARADRNERHFSVVLIRPAGAQAAGTFDKLLSACRRTMRAIDEIGWFDNHRVGILLPYTPAAGARAFVDRISQLTSPSPPAFTIHTYPGQWLPENPAVAGSPETLFELRTPPWKRAMDIVISVVALVLLSPVFAAVALVIFVLSPGPIFFKQRRVGSQGRSFTIWKFRTMKTGADNAIHQQHFDALLRADVPLTKLDVKGDPRIIPLGNLIRRCCLDELPQLFNVLRGDMTLVGPRPCLPFEVPPHPVWQRRRCDPAPGMTGLWQVSGKNRTTFKQMVRLDIRYLQRMSPAFDLSILLKTLPAIFKEVAAAWSRRRTAGPNANEGEALRSRSQQAAGQ